MKQGGKGSRRAAKSNMQGLLAIVQCCKVSSFILCILLNLLVPTEYNTNMVAAAVVVETGNGDGNALTTVMTTINTIKAVNKKTPVSSALVALPLSSNMATTSNTAITALNALSTITTMTKTSTKTKTTTKTTTKTAKTKTVTETMIPTTSHTPLDLDLPPTLPMAFGTENSTKVSAQSGSTALLPCVVHNLGDGVVSWIKHKSVQELLTVGLITYANDERFQAMHFHNSEDWTLQVKYVQGRDAGLYQCQVSTHPPVSIFVHLEVVEARAEIIGPREKYVRPGSTLRLHCVVRKSTETPSYLFWYHNYRMINYDIERGVNVSTDLATRESWLMIPRASNRHSGNYTCESSNAVPARVLVHVIRGDNPAAMQHNSARGRALPNSKAILFSMLVLLMVL